MEFKKGQTIYIRCDVGKTHVSGVEFLIDKINKKNGETYSLRGTVTKRITVNDGFSKKSFKNTYRLDITAYTFYPTVHSFMKGVNSTILNIKKVWSKMDEELSNFK